VVSQVSDRFIRADLHRRVFSPTGEQPCSARSVRRKVILVTRMKMSDEEEARDVYICDEYLAKQKKMKGKKKG